MIQLSSSQVDSVDYNPETSILAVRFKGKNPSIYEYQGVPAESYQGLIKAESPGKYLAQNIKGKFKYKKVR